MIIQIITLTQNLPLKKIQIQIQIILMIILITMMIQLILRINKAKIISIILLNKI